MPTKPDSNSPKTIFITGASSGIGEALALYYAAPGVTLYLTGRNGERLKAVTDICMQQGAKADDGLDVDGPTIAGTVKGNVATVTFHTAYPDSDGHGTATMTKNGDTLDWEITSSDGEHYLPKKALMTFKP